MGITHYCKVCGKQLTEFESECSRCASPTGYCAPKEQKRAENISFNHEANAEGVEPASEPAAEILPQAEEAAVVRSGEIEPAQSKWQKRGNALLWTVIVIVVLLAAAGAAVFLAYNGSIPFDDIARFFGI